MPNEITHNDAVLSGNAKTLRLFCLPYAAGSARVYRGWRRSLPKFVEVCPLELPGHGWRSRAEPLGELEAVMADLLTTVLRRIDKPIAILGYDYGALLGFELAHRLEQQYGVSPKHLFVAAMRAPMWPRPANAVSEMPDEEFRQLVRTNDNASGLLELDSLLEFAIRIVRADFRVVDNYEYKPGTTLDCPITAFRGLDDPGVSRQSMRAWNVCTKGEFRSHEINGGHYFLHPARDLFLHKLSQELRRYGDVAPVPRQGGAREPSRLAR